MAKKKKTHKKRHVGSFLLGTILLLFAAFGIYEAVHLAADKVTAIRDGSARFTESVDLFRSVDIRFHSDWKVGEFRVKSGYTIGHPVNRRFDRILNAAGQCD